MSSNLINYGFNWEGYMSNYLINCKFNDFKLLCIGFRLINRVDSYGI